MGKKAKSNMGNTVGKPSELHLMSTEVVQVLGAERYEATKRNLRRATGAIGKAPLGPSTEDNIDFRIFSSLMQVK